MLKKAHGSRELLLESISYPKCILVQTLREMLNRNIASKVHIRPDFVLNRRISIIMLIVLFTMYDTLSISYQIIVFFFFHTLMKTNKPTKVSFLTIWYQRQNTKFEPHLFSFSLFFYINPLWSFQSTLYIYFILRQNTIMKKFTDLQNRISLLSTDQKKAFFKHKSVSWSYDFFSTNQNSQISTKQLILNHKKNPIWPSNKMFGVSEINAEWRTIKLARLSLERILVVQIIAPSTSCFQCM